MTASEEELIAAAQKGDTRAFTLLTKPYLSALKSFVYRMAGHPDDSEDIRQEALLRAFTRIESFRGDAAFKTWLFSIATHICLDYVRSKKRWREHAQVYAQETCRSSPALRAEMGEAFASPGFVYDVGEHIAFCFTCVARSLAPEEEAAVILREVFDFGNQDAAKALGVTESVLRHHLDAGRKKLTDTYEGLCALVNKNGVCYQCRELRDLAPPGARGPEVPSFGDAPEEKMRRRLAIVRDAPLASGATRALHDLVFRRIAAAEHA
ncbi:MAG TPA: sigma-70 family RNA polymerase sigma factor [Labilithrix sp.]|jgi:RNA polymerase sigma-70 factor (ECF subfamily)